MRPRRPTPARAPATAAGRVATSAIGGAVAAISCAVVGPWQVAPLLGWDTASLIFLTWMWSSLWRADAAVTSSLAARENSSRPVADGALLLASVASLVGVGLLLLESKVKGGPISPALGNSLDIASIVLSWTVVHTVFTLRYAKLYYVDGRGSGIDFNQAEPPRYNDFAYLAFTIGMTFQVADTNLNDTAIRATVLRHAFLSYLFGAVILATTVNLIAGLAG